MRSLPFLLRKIVSTETQQFSAFHFSETHLGNEIDMKGEEWCQDLEIARGSIFSGKVVFKILRYIV